MDCPLKYIGQTGRIFDTRYETHIQAIRNSSGNLGYSNHILNTGHAHGSITNTMKVIKIEEQISKHTGVIPYICITNNDGL
jgi:hypothetical protein